MYNSKHAQKHNEYAYLQFLNMLKNTMNMHIFIHKKRLVNQITDCAEIIGSLKIGSIIDILEKTLVITPLPKCTAYYNRYITLPQSTSTPPPQPNIQMEYKISIFLV
jgi:hypothetical protein